MKERHPYHDVLQKKANQDSVERVLDEKADRKETRSKLNVSLSFLCKQYSQSTFLGDAREH